jgi:hypothetical protein
MLSSSWALETKDLKMPPVVCERDNAYSNGNNPRECPTNKDYEGEIGIVKSLKDTGV